MRFMFESIGRDFGIEGRFIDAVSYGAGNINHTFRATYARGGDKHYIFQRINEDVFGDVDLLMDNIGRVSEHLERRYEKVEDGHRRFLNFLRNHDGKLYRRDGNGECWRVYKFVENAKTHDYVACPRVAFQAAATFGKFQRLLADMPAPRLHDTIPDFHNTVKRYDDFIRILERDSEHRAQLAKPEIDFAMARINDASIILDAMIDGGIPERISHNDTKIGNVLIDAKSGKGICVIDLDTVMPGSALFDFGDLVRTCTCPVAEDERDLRKVDFNLSMFEAIADGFLASTGQILTPTERELLYFAGKIITLETGVRFLTDYLDGDKYFHTFRERHNLDRCRTQFKLVEQMEGRNNEIRDVVSSALAKIDN